MSPTNPFADHAPTDLEDRVLVTRARNVALGCLFFIGYGEAWLITG